MAKRPRSGGLAFRPGPQFPAPFEILQNASDQIAKSSLLAQQQAAKRQKENRAIIKEIYKYNPTAAINAYQSEIDAEVRELFELQKKLQDTAGSPESQEIIANRKQAIEFKVKKADSYKEVSNKNWNAANSDPAINIDGFSDVMAELEFDENGERRPLADLDENNLQIAWDDPKSWNLSVLTNQFAKGVEEKVNTALNVGFDAGGGFRKTTKTVSKFVQLDANNERTLNKTSGKLILNVGPDNLSEMMQIQGFRAHISKLVAEDGLTELQAANRIMANEGYLDETITGVRNLPQGQIEKDRAAKEVTDTMTQELSDIVDSGDFSKLQGLVNSFLGSSSTQRIESITSDDEDIIIVVDTGKKHSVSTSELIANEVAGAELTVPTGNVKQTFKISLADRTETKIQIAKIMEKLGRDIGDIGKLRSNIESTQPAQDLFGFKKDDTVDVFDFGDEFNITN